MAIQKRFIHFKKFSDFNSKKLSANEANTQYTVGISGAIQDGEPDVLYQSYCWIKDTKQQWTHGQLYDGATSDLSNYATKSELNNKVEKIEGKGLSTEDFTTDLKNKLDSLSEGNVEIVSFNTKESFESDLEDNNYTDNTIFFIENTKEIIVHKNVYKTVNWGYLTKCNIMSYKTNYAIINAILRRDSKLWDYESDYYYETIEDAIIDINNGSLGVLASEQNTSKIKVKRNNIFVLHDINIENNIDVTSTINIYLNSNKVVCNGTINVSGTLNIYGDNSNIVGNTTPFLNISGYCTLIGGKYVFNIKGDGTALSIERVISLSGTLNIKNVSLNVVNETGAASIIYSEENSILNGFNSIIDCSIKRGFAWGMCSKGTTKMEHCKIVAYADHTANAQGNDYGTTSRGILAEAGSLELRECYVYGAHSGMTVKCALTVNGGVYEGFSHGGLYLSNGNVQTKLYDAEFKDVDISEGNIFDSVAGTNHASFYIGAANNMHVYVDNCKFWGKVQPIVMKYNASSSHDNYLYLSNIIMNTDYSRAGIRNDGANYVYFGINNNISSSNLENNQNFEDTGLCYKQ